MNLSIGIVGLPNVGKSTLFNALTNASIEAENYPFCTIEPNKGIVPIKDNRLDKLAEVVGTNVILYATIEFVDIAGLVKGASEGAGLGNQFLANIREVAAVAHVIRNFEDDDIIHVNNKIDPDDDLETIETELILKDVETVKNMVGNTGKKARADKEMAVVKEWLEGLHSHLEEENLAYGYENDMQNDAIVSARKSLALLTDKPQLLVINTNDPDSPTEVKSDYGKFENLQLDIKLEYEISQLEEEEKKEYMEEFGIEETGLDKLAKKSFELLNLIYFFTAGEKEVRAWTVEKGSTVDKAAGKIHTDFEKTFISAEVVSYDDFVEYGGWKGSKEAGKVRLEGKTYIVKEGDVLIIKHN